MDFNRKDHIVVTIAKTGEKQHLLKSRIRSVAAVDPEQPQGPSVILYAQDDEGLDAIRLIVAEDEMTVVDAINGKPAPDDVAQMKRDIIRARQEKSAEDLRELEQRHAQPEKEIEAVREWARQARETITTCKKAVKDYHEGPARTWRGPIVEALYLKEAAEKRRHDPFSHHLYPDSRLLKIVGYGGLLAAVKAFYENQHQIEYEAGMEKQYLQTAKRLTENREREYQRERENLLRLRDEPHMTFEDRLRLEQRIREHSRSYGPAEEFRFQRDEKAAAYRPTRNIEKDRERERREQAQELADRVRQRGRRKEDDPERERELTRRLTRGRDRDGPDYSR